MPLKKVAKTSSVKGYVVYEPATLGTKQWPVLLLFHGIGERGDGTDAGLQNLFNFINSQWYPWVAQLQKDRCIQIAVQLPWDKTSWPISYVDDALAIARSKYNVDENRIYISGISLGGGAAWGYPAASVENGKKFAAILNCCCVGASGNWANIKSPTLAYHAKNDPTVGYGNSESIVNAINAGGGNAKLKSQVDTATLSGHEIWGVVYGNDEAWDWMLSQTKEVPEPDEKEIVAAFKLKNGKTHVVYSDDTYEDINGDSHGI